MIEMNAQQQLLSRLSRLQTEIVEIDGLMRQVVSNKVGARLIGNLIETLNRIHADLERIELWMAALACFQEAVPQYEPGGDYLLPPGKQAARSI